jgi:hypothetical protein
MRVAIAYWQTLLSNASVATDLDTEEVVHRARGRVQHLWRHVRIEAKGDRDMSVAEHLLHDLWVDALLQQECRCRMP